MSRTQNIDIDRDKVRTEARKLDGTGLRVWLDRAIDRLPDDAFPELIADYVHLRDVLADAVADAVAVRWDRVLSAWFTSLSAGTDAREWAETVVDALNDFAGYPMAELVVAARDAGTPEQRAALAEYEADLRRRRR